MAVLWLRFRQGRILRRLMRSLTDEQIKAAGLDVRQPHALLSARSTAASGNVSVMKSLSHIDSASAIWYGNVWEDAEVMCAALAPAAAGGRLLSIASAGDNALALLTLDPADVLAVDVSFAQLAALELRIAAFRTLADDEILSFLGVDSSDDRLRTYARDIRSALSPAARSFWDARPHWIRTGALHVGRFERYLALFRRIVLPLLHTRTAVHSWFSLRTRQACEEYYDQQWNTRRWRFACRLLFAKSALSRFRYPGATSHVTVETGSLLASRSRRAFTIVPPAENPYVTYLLTGNYSKRALPLYLKPSAMAIIRSRIDRLRLSNTSAETVPTGTRFDGMNLSDIFESLTPGDFAHAYAALMQRLRVGGRMAYWTLFVSRNPPSQYRELVREHAADADRLAGVNRAASYESFHIDERLG